MKIDTKSLLIGIILTVGISLLYLELRNSKNQIELTNSINEMKELQENLLNEMKELQDECFYNEGLGYPKYIEGLEEVGPNFLDVEREKQTFNLKDTIPSTRRP